jgi:hypothetical protein
MNSRGTEHNLIATQMLFIVRSCSVRDSSALRDLEGLIPDAKELGFGVADDCTHTHASFGSIVQWLPTSPRNLHSMRDDRAFVHLF